MSGFTEYGNYDGLGLAELVRTHQVKPIELVDEAISRIEKLNPELNAVICKTYEMARETAGKDVPDGPFKGVPFLFKDIGAAFAGVPMCRGSRFYQRFQPDHDSEMVRRFKSSGLISLGKTNTPEFGLLPITEPELFGSSNNPWDLGRTTGGSSGGSAAAVSARLLPLAHGNDGGGSIRIPASCCGVFGLKPTRGRNPVGPDIGEWWHGFACDHVLSLSVRDSAAALDATAGPDIGALYYASPPVRPFLEETKRDPGRLRIAFSSRPFQPATVHQDCLKGLELAVKLCQELGHEVIEADLQIDGSAFNRAFFTVVCCETRAAMEEDEAAVGHKASAGYFEAATWVVGLLGKHFKGSDLSKAIHFLQSTARPVGRFFQDYDVMLTPTLSRPPLAKGEMQPKGGQAAMMKLLGRLNAGAIISAVARVQTIADETFEFMPFTPLFNVTGQPAMSVPLHWNDQGLPIGIQFVGRYGDEATLFRLAAQLEKARPWVDLVPPIATGNGRKTPGLG
jgi:amidase